MELAVLVLRDLLQYSSQLPELARDIGTNHIPGLLTSLLALKPEVRPSPTWRHPSWKARSPLTSSFPPFTQCQLSILEGSKACMTFYPRACGSLRVSIWH